MVVAGGGDVALKDRARAGMLSAQVASKSSIGSYTSAIERVQRSLERARGRIDTLQYCEAVGPDERMVACGLERQRLLRTNQGVSGDDSVGGRICDALGLGNSPQHN